MDILEHCHVEMESSGELFANCSRPERCSIRRIGRVDVTRTGVILIDYMVTRIFGGTGLRVLVKDEGEEEGEERVVESDHGRCLRNLIFILNIIRNGRRFSGQLDFSEDEKRSG